MDNNDIQLVGGACGQHGPYTFYKAFKYSKNGIKRIVTLSEFFFVKLWIDSDLLCIGELQLLWSDKNSDQVLASLRLYFLPENTPEGRMDHGEDEVLAISEKVVLRVEDLITWITVDAEWTWGRLAKCERDVKEPPLSEDNKNIIGSLTESSLDFSDVEKERKFSECHADHEGPLVVILSYSRYCRYRAMMRRLEGVENEYLKYKIVKALGGFTAYTKNTRVLFCKDTFDYPELEGHELLCNHLAPKLKGRPRGKRKKRSVSPGSESNESESSVSNIFNTSKEKITAEGGRNGLRCDNTHLRRSARAVENNESKEFLKELAIFMKTNYTPIGKIPSLGYKELDLFSFYTKVQKLGGYDAVTTNRLWKSIFDDMSGHASSTSAATVIRRHYERFLLPYERHVKGEEYKPLPISERRRLKSKAGSSASDAETSESTSRSGNSTPVPQTSNSVSPTTPTTPTENREFNMLKTADGKTSSLRSVRVKPERQKDKPIHSDKLNNVQNNNNNNNNNIEVSIPEVTVDPVKIEKEEVSTTKPIENNSLTKVETVVKLESPTVTPSPPSCAIIPEKDAEPLTSAVAPVAQKLTPEKSHSPVEGKENIPIIKTGDTPKGSKSPDIVEVPYKPEVPEIIDLEADTYTSTNLKQPYLKKRKLDILKEGGLEVTPVRNFPASPIVVKDLRPSVIQPTGAQLQQLISPTKSSSISASMKNDFNNMPPPASVNSHLPKRSMPSQLDISQIRTDSTHKATPQKYSSFNGTGPPRVLQSNSIYSYSEKKIYGNPKDYMTVPAPPVHTPKFGRPRHLGGDILDLTVTSPQKPVVEIMKVPTPISQPPSFNSPAPSSSKISSGSSGASSYRSPSASAQAATAPMLDGRRLGSNLEITLVGSQSKPSLATSLHHHHHQAPTSRYNLPLAGPQTNSSNYQMPSTHHRSHHQQSHHHQQQQQQRYQHSHHGQKRISADSYVNSKIARLEENGKYSNKPLAPISQIPLMPHSKNGIDRGVDIAIPHPYGQRNPSLKSDAAKIPSQIPPAIPTPPNLKHYSIQQPLPPTSGPSSAMPTYLSHLYESKNFMPPMPPTWDPIYSAAMQSLYSPLSAPPPMLAYPSSEQLKFYTELMAHNSRNLNYPFPTVGSTDTGNPSVSNNFKKQ